jgi:hypothetical protein
LLILILVTMLVPTPAMGEFAYRERRMASSSLDGFQGWHNIRTDPATVNGIGYVHIMQMDTGALGGDFIAIGTAKGVGVGNCADDYDAKWTIYTDGISGGVYFCNDESVDKYAAGAIPFFQINWSWCPSASANRWTMYMGTPSPGTLWACYSNTSSTSRAAIAGLETTGGSTTDRNIDVKYTNLKTNSVGSSTWNNFNASTAIIGTDPNYSNTYVSATAFNVYLAPLD